MATARDAFHWLREYEYNIQTLSMNLPKLRDALGAAYMGEVQREVACNTLEGALEHTAEQMAGLKKLLAMVREEE